MIYYLSLGANLGDPRRQLTAGIEGLCECGRPGPISSLYRTRPQGMPADTPEFLNLALRLDSDLDPHGLLGHIKAIEAALGRDIHPGPPRSRPLDIDILLAGNRIIQTPDLVVPHPRMTRRAFVLVPLAEIAPEVIHPRLKLPIRKLRDEIATGNDILGSEAPLSFDRG